MRGGGGVKELSLLRKTRLSVEILVQLMRCANVDGRSELDIRQPGTAIAANRFGINALPRGFSSMIVDIASQICIERPVRDKISMALVRLLPNLSETRKDQGTP